MKFINLLILFALMSWTWCLANTPAAIPEATHIDIQSELKLFITERILELAPDVKDIRFEQFWTKPLNNNQIQAVFTYSFQEGEEGDHSAARIGIEGYALLNRGVDANGASDFWTLDNLTIENNVIEFKEGLNIQASPTEKK